MTATVEVLVLGPVRACVDGAEVVPGGRRERGVLAALALAGPAGLDHDRLVDQLWGPAAPPSAHRTAQAYLSRIRGVLGADAVRTDAGRHRLDVGRVDLWEFDDLVDRARRDPSSAARLLTDAVELWRDADPARDAALDGAAELLAAVRRSRLDAMELRLAHLDDAAAATAAEALVAEDPHRERAWGVLATARYRLGRQADALAALREARRRLAEDLGVDPSPDLAQLEEDILRHALVPVARASPSTPLTRLVGREALVGQVVEALGERRLVTLVGVGGIGKTRVALAVTEAVAASGTAVCVADLSSVSSARSVDDVLVEAIDAGGEEVEAAYARRFGRLPGLLVVDECEPVLATVAHRIERLLAGSPRLRVLATSRSPLGLVGEQLVDVPALGAPAEGDEPGDDAAPAMRLFLDRAAEVVDVAAWSGRDLLVAAEICRALDGIPLALEVAARRLRAVTLDELLDHVASGARSEDGPPGLEAALDDSVRALLPEQRAAYARLGLVQGTLSLVSAAGVGGDRGAVEALLHASLLTRTPHGVRMYAPVRRHAAARLSAEERQKVRARIAEELLAVTATAAPRLVGPDEVEWLRRVDALHADVRATLEWAEVARPDVVPQLTANVAFLWTLGWSGREGRHWLDQALVHQTPPTLRGWLWTRSSVVAVLAGDLERARADADQAVTLARAVGDQRLLGAALHARALPDKLGPHTRAARRFLDEAWEARRSCGDLAGAAMSLGAIADIDVNEGRLADAEERYAAGLPLMRRAETARGLLAYLHSMSELALMRGDADRARALVEEAEELARQTDDHWHLALLASVRAAAARDLGRPVDEQRDLGLAALRAAASQPDPQVLLDVVEHLAGLLVDRAEHQTAYRLLAAAATVRHQDGMPRSVPRQARRDADEAAALAVADPSRPQPAVDLDWLVAAAEEALRGLEPAR